MTEDATQPTHPTQPGASPSQRPRAKGARRAAVIGLAAVGVAGAVAVGGWAAVTLMSGGSQPAEMVPANALGYVSLDLDPSAGQKIEALRIAKKFPALDEELGLEAQDDLRRWVFEKFEEDSECMELDYDKQVAPWIGDRIAVAGVPGKDGDSAPLVALQVTDEEAAAKGIDVLLECGEGSEDVGYTITEGYALFSDSEEQAVAIARAAGKASLAEDPDFVAWTEKLEPGIVTAYAAPGALASLVDMRDMVLEDITSEAAPDTRAELEQAERMADRVSGIYEDFGAMAGVVRFADGAVELEMAMDKMPEEMSWAVTQDPSGATELPGDTAAVYAIAVPDGFVRGYLDLIETMFGEEVPLEQGMRQLEAQTGLELPEDIETLLGDGISLAVDTDLDIEAAAEDPMTIAAGLRIKGDRAGIGRVLQKVKNLMGPDQVLSVEVDDAVAVGLNTEYVETLAARGTLGEDATFQDAVPDAESANTVMYLEFDALTRWIEQGTELEGGASADDRKVLDNIEPMAAFGAASWFSKDGSSRALMRLTTD